MQNIRQFGHLIQKCSWRHCSETGVWALVANRM